MFFRHFHFHLQIPWFHPPNRPAFFPSPRLPILISRPKLTQPQGKFKRNTWQKHLDQGVTPEDAEKRYIELVEELLKAEGKSL